MSTTTCSYSNWVQFDSPDPQDEETLSLSDLPINDLTNNPQSKKEKTPPIEDFDFGSSFGLSPKNRMCNADEVFFQGQILPLRHSVSSDSALLSGFKLETRDMTRSESMSIITSRSSSIRSHNSTSSASSSSTSSKKTDPRARISVPLNGYKPRIRNQFHSHPSPTPQIRTKSFRSLSYSNPKTSSLWSFLQVGVLKPQEIIGLSDLKNRSKRFGSHNSNSSSNSSSINSTMDHQNHHHRRDQNKIFQKNKIKMMKKPRLFFGGCKCTVNSVENSVKEKEDDDGRRLAGERDLPAPGNGKQAASRSRTFEWLKQLSIQESGGVD